jgi:hypothetical protein
MAGPHVIENPVTGERAVFLEVAEHATGELLRFDLFVRPGGFVPGANDHIHPRQEESFFMRAGTVRLRMGGEERHCTIGEEVTVPAGHAPRLVECGRGRAACSGGAQGACGRTFLGLRHELLRIGSGRQDQQEA